MGLLLFFFFLSSSSKRSMWQKNERGERGSEMRCERKRKVELEERRTVGPTKKRKSHDIEVFPSRQEGE